MSSKLKKGNSTDDIYSKMLYHANCRYTITISVMEEISKTYSDPTEHVQGFLSYCKIKLFPKMKH